MVDYIIIGGGYAGCALAARLTEKPDVSVLMLETGPRDTNPYIHQPLGFYKMTSGPLTWGPKTAPQRHANNREIPYAQGRVLGGGSSINAEVFTRGCPEDNDVWANEYRCTGWSLSEIQPFYLRSEHHDTYSDSWHGVGAPLGGSSLSPPHKLTRAFVQACQQFGIPYNPDFNGPRQVGPGPYQTTTRNARRCSTATGHRKPALSRRNLTIDAYVFVKRIVVESGRVRCVEMIVAGRAAMLRAEREIILTAGAIRSPKLMLLSGLGPADDLRALGIDVAADLPEVGRNPHYHFGVDFVYELSGLYSLDTYAKLHWMVWAGLEYLAFRKGPVASSVVEGGAFWYADRASLTPDLQFHFLIGAGVEAGVPRSLPAPA